MNTTLEVKGLKKRFTGVQALDDVSFCCEKGTVHVLQGENGAGKSTLLKIISGLYPPDAGEIYLYGKPVQFKHPREAIQRGVSMVYQEMTVLPDLTVAQNIFLNHEKHKGKRGLIDESALIQKTIALAEQYHIPVDPYATAGDLPIAAQQMVEILKALSTDPELLILDEPTSALTKAEVQNLHRIVQTLQAHGKTILFISHRMEEVFQFGQRMTVLKDGKLVATVDMADVDADRVIKLMVGRDLQDIFPPHSTEDSGEELFRVQDFCAGSHVSGVDITLRRGEITGIAALQGQGQTELLQALAGMRKHDSGDIFLKGKRVSYQSTAAALRLGIGYVPEDRKGQALCLGLSIRENLALCSLGMRQRAGFIQRKKERGMVERSIATLNIRTPSMEQYVKNLSGGNQQKVVLGKSLAIDPTLLVLNEPTRGIDVEAKQEVYTLVRDLAERGVAIILYSSDMMELIGLSDTILAMYEGKITARIPKDQISEETVMRGIVGMADAEHSGVSQ